MWPPYVTELGDVIRHLYSPRMSEPRLWEENRGVKHQGTMGLPTRWLLIVVLGISQSITGGKCLFFTLWHFSLAFMTSILPCTCVFARTNLVNLICVDLTCCKSLYSLPVIWKCLLTSNHHVPSLFRWASDAPLLSTQTHQTWNV